MRYWKTLDLAAMLKQEVAGATTSANAGSYAVPLGRPLRRYPITTQDSRRKRETEQDMYGGYTDYEMLMPSRV
jgi:hypothetical protein